MARVDVEVRQFILDNFLFGREEEIDAKTSFIDSGLIDSTGVLELVSFLEERYGISVLDEDLVPENLDSLERVKRFVEEKLTAGAESGHAA